MIPGMMGIIASGRRRVAPVVHLQPEAPVVTLASGIVLLGDTTDEGQIVAAVGLPWFKILEAINKDREAMYALPWRGWEEMIAGAYEAAGFEVTLTPRSGDLGRDVIAVKKGLVAIRILEQVKAYKPGRLVSAQEVQSMLGVASGDRNCSKVVVTTTSGFAPKIAEHPGIQPFIPYRLELRPSDELIPWLNTIKEGNAI